MAHINQREVREQRRRRRAAFLSIFLLIPLFLAGYFFYTITFARLTAETVKEIVLTHSSHSETITEREDIARLMGALENAIKITESARPLSEYEAVTLTCSDEYNSARFTLYLSDSANDALMVNEEEKLHTLTPADATALLLSEEFSFLYRSSPDVMELKLGDEVHYIAPAYTWHYTVADGSERTAEDTPAVLTLSAKGAAPVFTVPGEPDETRVTVTVGNDRKTGTLAELTSLLPKTRATVDVSVGATWSNPEADGYYGTAQYHFILDYTPAEA